MNLLRKENMSGIIVLLLLTLVVAFVVYWRTGTESSCAVSARFR